MTVGELIAKLGQCPLDSKVYIDQVAYTEVVSVLRRPNIVDLTSSDETHNPDLVVTVKELQNRIEVEVDRLKKLGWTKADFAQALKEMI